MKAQSGIAISLKGVDLVVKIWFEVASLYTNMVFGARAAGNRLFLRVGYRLYEGPECRGLLRGFLRSAPKLTIAFKEIT